MSNFQSQEIGEIVSAFKGNKSPGFNGIFLLIIKTVITGSTVVLTCCKGDGQSQWKTPIFGPSQLGNPLTDFDKI